MESFAEFENIIFKFLIVYKKYRETSDICTMSDFN